MERLQLPTKKCQAPRYKPHEQSETHTKRTRKRWDIWSDHPFIKNL